MGNLFTNPKYLNGLKPNKPKPRIENIPAKKSSSASSRDTDEKNAFLKKPATKSHRDDLKKTAARGLSASPALKPIASPSHNKSPNPSNGSLADQAKLDRAPLVHELAVKPQSTDHLRNKWQGRPEDFNKALEKVADQKSGKWELRDKAWQELDVWNYDYDEDDRQAVINAAPKKFDKARISPSDPIWEKLVPKNERGQGKGASLSKVQKRIAEGPAAAPAKLGKIAANRTDENSNSSKDNDDTASDRSKGGESMARVGSTKGKKPNGKEAQVKRLLGKTKSTTTTKAATPKTSPSKPKAAPSNGKKVLSAEIVENSDSSGDEAPAPAAPKPKPVTKPVEKPAEKLATKAKAPASTSASASKATTKPAAKPAKRPLPAEDDGDDSSSSSGAPLAKRNKMEKPAPAPQRKRPEMKPQPPRDYSRYNNKNTSPTKSSPLASSPPTNASDMSSSSNEDRLSAASKKRKANDDSLAPAAKRQYRDQLIQRAQRFKSQYIRYEALHREVARMTHPPQNKVDELLREHERLKKMKQKIYDDQDLVRL